jgi:hypothetical protein
MAVQQPEVAAVSAQQTFPADEKIAPQTVATDAEANNDARSLDNKPHDESDVEYDTKEKQYGVEKIRAITSAWTWHALILTYALYSSLSLVFSFSPWHSMLIMTSTASTRRRMPTRCSSR